MQHQLILCHLAKKAKQMYNQKKNPSIMPQTGHRHKCGLSTKLIQSAITGAYWCQREHSRLR